MRKIKIRTFICVVLGIAILSAIFSSGLSFLIAKKYQADMIMHDYKSLGYLCNQPSKSSVAAFTQNKTSNDYYVGKELLQKEGYTKDISLTLLPEVTHFRNQVLLMLSSFFMIQFSILYIVIAQHKNKQKRIQQMAQTTIRRFLDGDTSARIESSETGTWCQLFNEVNELSTMLSAQVEQEKKTKEFLKAMISDISHQLKTPLAALKMYYEIMCDETTEPEDVLQFREKSIREMDRMEDVIYTLLKLARIDAGTIQMNKKKENLWELMQDVLERFELWASKEDKTISLLGRKDCMLECDALWFLEAVGNIVKNALEHIDVGGKITINWERTPLLTNIMIEDNGNGIHPEDIYNIFKRFYRTRFAQKNHGIGLGLPLAKSIVEAHGGTISVSSKIGIGTKFTISLFNLTEE